MEYNLLGRSDLRASRIGLGGATFGREIDAATAYIILDRAFERGITLFDTAAAYSAGQSETILGNWIHERKLRDQIVLTTKVAPPLGGERIIASAEESLRRLRVDVIDLFQLHSWDANTPLEQSLVALDTLVQSGKVRYIGCSNFAAWQLCKALWRAEVHGWVRLESVQPVYNVALRQAEQELLPLCADQRIGVITYSPLGAGFLTGKYHQGGPVPRGTRFDIVPGHQDIYFNDTAFNAMERLRATARQHNCSMAQLGLAWVLSRTGVTTTLVGARTTEQVDQAFAAADLAATADFQSILNTL